MINESGLRPLGLAVLVVPYEPEEVKKSVIVIPDTAKERQVLLEQRAIVVEVGPEAWRDEQSPRAKPGDKVMIGKFAGAMIIGPKDGKQYRMVNDRDIFAGLEEV